MAYIFMRKSLSKGPLRHIFRPARVVASPLRPGTRAGRAVVPVNYVPEYQARLPEARKTRSALRSVARNAQSASPLRIPESQQSASSSSTDLPSFQSQFENCSKPIGIFSTSEARNLAIPSLRPMEVPRLRDMYRSIIREHQRLKAKIASQQMRIQKLVSERLPGPCLESNFKQRRGLSSALDCYLPSQHRSDPFSGLLDSREEHSSHHYTVPSTSTPSPKPHREGASGERQEKVEQRKGTSVPKERRFPKEVFPMSFKRRPAPDSLSLLI